MTVCFDATGMMAWGEVRKRLDAGSVSGMSAPVKAP
jgi:hypothetical protein